MENKTKNGVTNGLFWTFGERITAQLISTIVGIVLARVLDPEHYGIIAIVTVFITFFNVFVTSGFSSAVVQKKDVDDLDYDTAFYIGLAVSIIAYVILFFTSNFIADFYKYAFVSIVPDWIDKGMIENPELIVLKVINLITGTINHACMAMNK